MDSSSHTSDTLLEATAYHEAGHAVIALALGRPVQRVSIAANQLRLGLCEFKKGSFRPTHDAIETEMLILLGGLAAEARHTDEYAWDGASADLRIVRKLAEMRAGSARQTARLERRMLDKTEYFLDQPGHWEAVMRMAAELLKTTVISGRAARHIFDEELRRAEREG